MRNMTTQRRLRRTRVARSVPLLCLIYLAMLAAQPLAARGAPGSKVPASSRDLDQCENAPDPAVSLSACLLIAQDESYANADRSLAYAMAGYDKLGVKQIALATTYFDQALQLDPNSDFGLAGRGSTRFINGNYEGAIEDAKRAIELGPNDHPDAYLLLGTLADRNGDHEARISYMSKAIALAPQSAAAFAGRGNGYLREHKYDQALTDFNRAIAINPSLAATLKQNFEIVYIERGALYMRSGNSRAAIDNYTRALQINPRSTRALNDRGDAYNTLDDYENGIKDFTKAIQMNPANPYPYMNRGVSRFSIGKDDQALLDLDKAIEIDDKLMLAYFVRGEVYKKRSDFISALRNFRKALELTPGSDPRRANILSAIESLKQ